MKGAVIAAGLLLTVLSFALAFVPPRTGIAAAIVAALAALLAAAFGRLSPGAAFIGCWVSLGLAALSVYWPRLAHDRAVICLALAVNAGAWAGLVAATEGRMLALLSVLPLLLLGIPAAWCISRGWAIVPRVVTSWLLAVAILVGAIPHLVAHPGYVPDHRS